MMKNFIVTPPLGSQSHFSVTFTVDIKQATVMCAIHDADPALSLSLSLSLTLSGSPAYPAV